MCLSGAVSVEAHLVAGIHRHLILVGIHREGMTEAAVIQEEEVANAISSWTQKSEVGGIAVFCG